MKEKVGEAWRRETRTINRQPGIVETFAHRLENELREQINKDVNVDRELEQTLVVLFLWALAAVLLWGRALALAAPLTRYGRLRRERALRDSNTVNA